jgi:mannose-1-phosphate guanylyltransferase
MKRFNNVYAVIIAGGEGRRLWPLSTPERPKQFISVFGGKPLIRHAVDRLMGLVPPRKILVVTASRFIPLTRAALPDIPAENIVGEPCRRDTAGAAAIACALVKRLGGDDAVGCILPADHIITPEKAFRRTLKDAVAAAASTDSIVTIGIRPDRPASEYGYIECLGEKRNIDGAPAEPVRRFTEKPDRKTAARYLRSGRHLWNAGLFVWRSATLEAAFAAAAPDIGKLIRPLASAKNFSPALKRLYPGIRPISFDYAVMEKIKNILVVRGDFSWDDVGSLLALTRHLDADSAGNVRLGDAVLHETGSSVAVTDGAGPLILAGLKNVIAVRSGNAVLVMAKEQAGNMREITARVNS